MTVDVIIPVSNAFDELKDCVQSVLKHANDALGQIVLIVDESADDQMLPYLTALQESHKGLITIVCQKENRGFTANVNKGLEITSGDVVLLNTDTIVTAGWLDKMIACAYRSPQAGTVTPLTNLGGICSVPEPGANNVLPSHMTLEEYADMIEQRSLKQYPTIGVAMGFCMYIKREVLDAIGFFDAEGFQNGYGAEQDFCFRASRFGYLHFMCDDTFIYQKATLSYPTEGKNENTNCATSLLQERYPEQMHAQHSDWVYGQQKLAGYQIKMFGALKNGKTNILHMIQADFREDAHNNVGGTQLHVKDLVMAGSEEANMFVLARDGEYLRLTIYINTDRYSLKFHIGSVPQFPIFYDRNICRICQNVLAAFSIDLVHVHHTMGLSLDIFHVAHEMKIPIMMTLHDFYTICPSINLIDYTNKLCVGKQNTGHCSECIKHRQGIATSKYIEIWRKNFEQVFMLCEHIIIPTHAAEEIVAQYYPAIAEKLCVIEHGLDSLSGVENRDMRSGALTPMGQLNIAFIGGINEIKGGVTATEVIRRAPREIEWFIIGEIGERSLVYLEQDNLTKTGKYERKYLNQLLLDHKIDLVCILSIWPETFCYTLSEAIMAGVPVIVTDIGALGERVRRDKSGWVVPLTNTADAVLALLDRFLKNPDAYSSVLHGIHKIKLKTVKQMSTEYQAIYCTLASDHDYQYPYEQDVIAQGILQGDLLHTSNCSGSVLPQLEQTTSALIEIKSSAAYKTAGLLSKIPIPFRKQIKNSILFSYSLFKKLLGHIKKH